MILILDPHAGPSVRLEAADDCGALSVLSLGGTPHEDARLLAPVGALRDGHAWLDADALRTLAAAGSVAEGWTDRFDAMLAFAGSRGWVDERGRIRAHVESRTAAATAFVRGLLPSLLPGGPRLPSGVMAAVPADTARAAQVPAGVHLAVTGTATGLALDVRAGVAADLAAPGLGSELVVRHAGGTTGRVPVGPGASRVVVELPERRPGDTVRVFLPESPQLEVLAVEPIGGDLRPPPRGPRWVVYGDSITQGWTVGAAGEAWPSLVAERLGLEAINLGFAGSARGETALAEAVAASGAALVTIAWGTNNWSTVPHTAAGVAQTMRDFLDVVRSGLPAVPVTVVGPLVRPAAETTRNAVGATLAELRTALEQVVRERIERGDPALDLVGGLDLVGEDLLVDGVHPGPGGHRLVADGVLDVLARQAVPGGGA